MQLSKRKEVFILPSYSLTGDLVGFERCGLQYRYTRVASLPSTRPVQMWFGQFIHGVMEEAFRRYRESIKAGWEDIPPWANAVMDSICDGVMKRLAAEGLYPWDRRLEKQSRDRAKVMVNELGPDLLPLIEKAEVRLTGSRALPTAKISPRHQWRTADRYELVGVVDVITDLILRDASLQNNRLVRAILDVVKGRLPDEFEVIIDYKGMRRPPVKSKGKANLGNLYEWQLQTYAHLREAQEDAKPVKGGVIIYVNELLPFRRDIDLLADEIRTGETDEMPAKGSADAKTLKAWRKRSRKPLPKLSAEYRLRRALRIVTVTATSKRGSLRAFDDVVAKVETCHGKERLGKSLLLAWDKNPADRSTCEACDVRTFCPAYTQVRRPTLPTA